MKIVVTMEVQPKHQTILTQAAGQNDIVFTQEDITSEDATKALGEADIIIGNIPTDLVKTLPKLKWLQLNSAGSNQYCEPGVLRPDVALTNATGAYGIAIAEYMVGILLEMMKKLPAYYDNQKQSLWRDEGPVPSLYGATVLVVGYGDIGSRCGTLLKAFGAHVIGIRRRHGVVPPECDAMGTMEDFATFAKDAAIVAASLPETAATHHYFDASLFQAMKQGTYFLNVGRGTSVVQEDLRQALVSGHLGGAAIDVTDPEPLPSDSPLWQTPNLYITPHVSGGYHVQTTHDLIVDIAARNLRYFLANEPLENIVDRTTGYKQ